MKNKEVLVANSVNLDIADYIIWYCNQSELLRGAEVQRMGQDCSNKIHYRIKLQNGRSYVIVDISNDSSIADSLIKIHNFIVNKGFSAPKILDYNKVQNLILMEDFGNRSYKEVLQQEPKMEGELYSLAVEVLKRISSLKVNIDLPFYGPALLGAVLIRSFNNHYRSKKDAAAELNKIFHNLFSQLTKFDALVLRDYHIDNMMLLEDRQSHQKVGLLDIQDAAVGHVVYDLVSLLEDARRDVSVEVVEKSKHDFLKLCIKINKANKAEFDYAYSVLGMQRSLRILWLFSYLQGIAGKEKYGQFLPRIKNYIKQGLKNPIFKDLLYWSDKYKIQLCD